MNQCHLKTNISLRKISMKTFRSLFTIILSLGLLYLGVKGLNFGDTSVPPVLKLFSPNEGFYATARIADKIPETITSNGKLAKELSILYDDKLVPHIYAKSDEAAFFAQGYVEAQHRLWQMDFISRATGGNLSEIVGNKALALDKKQRAKGMMWAAENIIKVWKENPSYHNLMNKYVEGINAYVSQLKYKDYPLEFKLIGYEPQAWDAKKSALILLAMCQSLNNGEYDWESTISKSHFSEDDYELLYPEVNPNQKPIIPKGTEWNFSPLENNSKTHPILSSQLGRDIPPLPKMDGSNNWVVAASKTKNGKPILCNDPHLDFSLPAIWYELHISTDEYSCYGVSIPGISGINLGFNENIAWGFTNVGHDVTDWYVVDWVDDNKTHYWLDGKKVQVETRVESISIKGMKPSIDTIKYCHWGPIQEVNGTDIAMRWLSHKTMNPSEQVFNLKLNKASNLTEWKEAVDAYEKPAQNIVFASKDGDIALNVSGTLPLRAKDQGKYIELGNDSKNGWNAYIPKAHNPFSKNPERQFLASANQMSTDEDYPYPYNGSPYFEDYRGQYLNDQLAMMDQITVEDMMNLQLDNTSQRAIYALPQFLKLIDKSRLNEEQTKVLNHLAKWDYRYEAESKNALRFQEWFSHYYSNTWDEIQELKDSIAVRSVESWVTIELLNDPNNKFFDLSKTAKKETAIDIVTHSFLEMFEKTAKLDEDYTWVDRKATKVQHLGRIEAFSYHNMQNGGVANALNAMRPGGGPSWRMIVELGEEIKAYGIYPGGQSGNPASKYYNNMIDKFSKGEYYTLLFPRTELSFPKEKLLAKTIIEP